MSDENPKIVDILLRKIADYFDQSAPLRYPEYDLAADPMNFGGVWKPWRKSEEELREENFRISEKL